ncbi:MAG TPA: hypothetical protein DEQ34_07085 [Balneolaceae bacterium]|nr:hypothetical protein [Balneolaceae bacterium]|tara:strand:- start:186359 stop:187222 length:864 start_codon:yes stop_codon:yes gene_type:complete
MSYAIRNTIILLVTLLLIVGIGYSYSEFYLQNKVSNLQEELRTKQNDFNSKDQINSQFEELNNTYEKALKVIENYDKVLYQNNRPDNVFEFLNKVNGFGDDKVYYDYVFDDTLSQGEYGIITSTIAGYGKYSALTNFVNRIENSQLLNKISQVAISPGRNDDGPGTVNFTFTLESYYQKAQIFDSVKTDHVIKLNEDISTYNPFRPLIQSSIPPNTEGLVSIETSRIIGITANRVFIKDGGGSLISLKVGDKVYLGYLSSINIKDKTATFNLNKGGIQEVITLEVDR